MISPLSIHGFVLAGGRSTRMGQDKARLLFQGEPMVQTAVTTLIAICEHVSIAGNRGDLEAFAPIVQETRVGVGPLAGVEAGLLACRSAWALFIPVDVPLLPSTFLYAWAQAVLSRPSTRASYICHGADPHPAICMLRPDCVLEISQQVENGERRLQSAFAALKGLWVAEAEAFATKENSEHWLTNINTSRELEFAERPDKNGER